MKIEAAYDGHGEIVAAIGFDADDDPRPRPQPAEGQHVGVFDIPDDHAAQPLDELCRSMVVDARRGILVDRRSADSP